MTREELIYEVCPYKSMINCHSEEPYTHFKCKDCSILMNKWLDEYDKHVIEQYKADTNLKDTIKDIHDNVAKEMYCKGIDDFANYLVEQGILGNRCISDGEITDYGKVYAKKYKEQLKVGGKNE